MMEYSQQHMEAMYSQRNIHTVLHNAIRYELDKLFINWALRAFLKINTWLEGTYYESKNKRLQELSADIHKKGLDSLVVAIAAAVVHTHNVQTIQQCVGYLQAFLPHEDPFDRAKTAAELLAICSQERGFYEIARHGQGVPATIKVNHWPFIDKKLISSFDWINNTCFNLPLLEPPLPVISNYSCGYHTLNEPLLLGKHTFHLEKQDYETVNILNSIQWVLDKQVIAEPETPSKPLTTTQSHINFLEMARDSRFVYKLLINKVFWLCWQYDSRGRIYSHGYHVNLQAAEYKKACLSFNKYEVLT